MKFLLLCGSLRKDSLNRKLMHNLERMILENHLGEVVIADLKELNLPLYDGDIEAAGFPKGVYELGEMIATADAFITCSPEYNRSISSPLKNAIDWVSRLKPVPLTDKPVLLTGASPGALGAVRGLENTHGAFEALNAFLYPQNFGLAKAHEAFDRDDKLTDPKVEKQLTELLQKFKGFSEKINN